MAYYVVNILKKSVRIIIGGLYEKDELKKIIMQIRKYDLTTCFETPECFEDWVQMLNSKQIINFTNLNIDPSEIMFPAKILSKLDLLSCEAVLHRRNIRAAGET